MMTIQPVIGLEIHLQLATQSKLFCGCRVEFGAEPNSRACPVCLGLPGALPVINRQALKLAARMALALNCRIARVTRWDRKSYFYPDLPKNYQITQYDMPLAQGGLFEFEHEGGTRHVRIRRAHLEEDAGKNLHDDPRFTRVDLNRTGTPLLEIVTEPDLHSAEEAHAFCAELQKLATYLGVSEGVMQKGQMRFEPNVNVVITENSRQYATPICEVKNLNSFRSIRGAIEYEISRHVETWQQDHGYTLQDRGKENRGWDDQREITVYQRSKEEAHDYRYFPDPDLLPVVIDEAWLAEVKAELPELPIARRARLVRDCGLSPRDAAQIVDDRATADLFDAALAARADPKVLGKHFISFWSKHANDQQTTVAGLNIAAARMAELTQLVLNGRINSTAAATISERMLESHDSPAAIATAHGLEQIRDNATVEAYVDQAIAANPQAAEMVRRRDKKWEKSIGFLQGQVMRLSKGSAPPQLVREILEARLGLRQVSAEGG